MVMPPSFIHARTHLKVMAFGEHLGSSCGWWWLAWGAWLPQALLATPRAEGISSLAYLLRRVCDTSCASALCSVTCNSVSSLSVYSYHTKLCKTFRKLVMLNPGLCRRQITFQFLRLIWILLFRTPIGQFHYAGCGVSQKWPNKSFPPGLWITWEIEESHIFTK